MNIHHFLTQQVLESWKQLQLSEPFDPQVRPATKSQFGDYQINGVMPLAKRLKRPPQELALLLIEQLRSQALFERIELAGPGFINLFLSNHWLGSLLQKVLQQPRCGVTQVGARVRPILIDYSAPNVAKEMAVHHLRSTVIGDAMARTFEFLGYSVIRANHIGDWGTQFGLLIADAETLQKDGEALPTSLQALEKRYKKAKEKFDTDPAFAQQAREAVVRLQRGELQARACWKRFVDLTMEKNQRIYEKLNVTLQPKDNMPESLYNPLLQPIVEELTQQGLAVIHEGAVVVLIPEVTNQEGKPMGVILQKSDGGHLYATTDLACAKYRCEAFHPSRVLYYVDARQHQHLMHVWEVARRAGYIPKDVAFEHHLFGMMLDSSGRPFKTRSGGTVKLSELIDEAIERASALIASKNPSLSKEEHHQAAQAIGVGSLKYADLSRHRATDYVFDWEQMLSFEGNTAPYLQYAYARTHALLRRAGTNGEPFSTSSFTIQVPIEHSLTVKLLQFEETLQQVASQGLPHLLCLYLYQLAVQFSQFYEAVPILTADTMEQKSSRLQLTELTAATLRYGLQNLGIAVVERM